MADFEKKRAHIWSSILDDDLEEMELLLKSCTEDECTELLNNPLDFSGELKELESVIPLPDHLIRERLDIKKPWSLCAAVQARKVASLLLKYGVDVTGSDHGGLNIIHVLAGVGFISPGRLDGIVSYYQWIKTAIGYDDLEVLLHRSCDQRYTPMEYCIHLSMFRLASEILETEGIYVITRNVGMYEYKAYDITDTEGENLFRPNVFNTLVMMSSDDMCKPETKEFLNSEPIRTWFKTKRRFTSPFAVLWLLIRVAYLLSIVGVSELRNMKLLNTKDNTTGEGACPSILGNITDGMHPFVVLLSTLVFAMSAAFFIFDIFTLLPACLSKLGTMLATPTGYKKPSMYPLFCRIMQLLMVLLSTIYTGLILQGNLPVLGQQFFVITIAIFIFWQILYFGQLLSFLGYCVITLPQMTKDLASILIVILVFIGQQAYVLRIVLNPCPNEYKSYTMALLEMTDVFFNGINVEVKSTDLVMFRIWHLGFYIIGNMLIMNFLIAVFANTVSKTEAVKEVLLTLQQHYMLTQAEIVTYRLLKPLYKRRHRQLFKHMNGRIYITIERMVKNNTN